MNGISGSLHWAGLRVGPIMRIFLLALVLAVFIYDCTAIEKDKCSSSDRCQSKTRACSCAEDCMAYGTCCKGLVKHLNHTSGQSHMTDNHQSFYCYSQRTGHPVFAKRACPLDFRGHKGTVDACLDVDVDEMDVGNNHIVTSQATKITYWNKHCAYCNYEKEEDLEHWNIVVLCPARKGVDKTLVQKNLTYLHEFKEWGLSFEGNFLKCFIKYAPSYYVEEVKHCTPNLISSCPDYFEDKLIASKCLKYYGERRQKSTDRYFKNIHCAICNGVDVKELECSGMTEPEDFPDESEFRDMIEVEFTKGRWLEHEVGKRFECSKGFLYDPFWERCRRHVNKELVRLIVDVSVASEKRQAFLWLFLTLIVSLIQSQG